MNNKRNAIIALIVVVIAGLIYYRDTLVGYLSIKKNDLSPQSGYEASAREITDTVDYSVPDGSDTVKFSVFVDKDGTIVGLKLTDMVKDNEDVQNHYNVFAEKLLPVIKGKKLSEIGPVDKVGTSSLTTSAFNSSLEKLKAQL